MLLTLDYNITEVPWWAPKYTVCCTVSDLSSELQNLKQKISENYSKENDKYFKGYEEFHRLIYLRETLLGENIIIGETTIEKLEKLLIVHDKQVNQRQTRKVQNLYNAVQQQFASVFDIQSKCPVLFTPDLLKNIHSTVGKDIIHDPGAYRTKGSAPSGEDWVYLSPDLISSSLEKLCRFVQDELMKPESSYIIFRVKISATFMTHFLQIHPFSNGNGRVARLGVSWLLSGVSLVPVPLYSSTGSSNTYLECLRESRYHNVFKPSALARLILESIVRAHRNVCLYLDLSN